MKRILYIAAGIAGLLAVPSLLQAQSVTPADTAMNRTVVVEQEYNPDIMDAAKVNVLPRVEEPTVGKTPVKYATTFAPAASLPVGVMGSYGRKEIQAKATPGYVRAGYGNYGNVDLLASYLFCFSERDKLNLQAQMEGMNGKLTLPLADEEKWKARYYRTRADMDYIHQFDRLDLNVAGNFGVSNFNLLPGSELSKQRLTSGGVHFGLKLTDETAPLRFDAETNLLMAGRQQLLRNETTVGASLKETVVRTKGTVVGAINDRQLVGIGLAMNNFIYGGSNGRTLSDNGNVEVGAASVASGLEETAAFTTDGYGKNYTALLLNPYYELDGEHWQLHVGANVDFSFGFDKTLRVSPDVTAQYVFAKSYALYAKATGGKRMNDFRSMESACPYSIACEQHVGTELYACARPLDTYEQLNASLGFKASPYTGVWFHFFGGYQNLKNDLMYAPSLLFPVIYGAINPTLAFRQENTSNVYAGGELTYAYKDWVDLAVRYTYRNWDSSENTALLGVKPENELSASVVFRPLAALHVEVGYDYIGHRQENAAWALADVNDLHVGAGYTIYKGVGVYAKVRNLLNRKFQYFPGYPTEGFNVVGGLSFRF